MELMDLQLGLALSTNSGAYHNTNFMHPTTLSLLPQHHHHPHTKDEKEEEGGVVGWPPLNYWRNIVGEDSNDHNHMVWVRQHASSGTGGGSSNSLYVKVKMEGVGIARKVDLRMHQSFHSLKETLMDMFGKCHQQSNSYQLAYQDKEGDWLLAQDISWRQLLYLSHSQPNQTPINYC